MMMPNSLNTSIVMSNLESEYNIFKILALSNTKAYFLLWATFLTMLYIWSCTELADCWLNRMDSPSIGPIFL